MNRLTFHCPKCDAFVRDELRDVPATLCPQCGTPVQRYRDAAAECLEIGRWISGLVGVTSAVAFLIGVGTYTSRVLQIAGDTEIMLACLFAPGVGAAASAATYACFALAALLRRRHLCQTCNRDRRQADDPPCPHCTSSQSQ